MKLQERQLLSLLKQHLMQPNTDLAPSQQEHVRIVLV
jgi:hypothetical protein